MNPENTSDRQILADIERLRTQFADTQELYREVCVLLFFRFGITPTANKLYQLVRKGSMSAPAEALEKFWNNLREKSRVRIEHPDLPDVLKTVAGDLVATLWGQAQASAHESLAVFRAEAQAAALEAQTAKNAAEAERSSAQAALEEARQLIQQAHDCNLELERQLAGERAGKVGLSAQLEDAGHQQLALEAALAEARREFTSELEKMRLALQLSEERHEASEKRSLLEIDRERTTSVKLQKELTQLRQNNLDAGERHRAEIGQLQHALGEARQNVGIAEGALQEMRISFQQQAEQLRSLQIRNAERDTLYALLQRDMEACEGKKTVLEKELVKLQIDKPATASRPKRSRKTAND